MITLENWRQRMGADMQLRDYRPRTRSGYELATRLFLDWAKTEPAALTEEHVRAYFLFLREVKKQAPSSINVAICALRFFCTHTLGHDWPVFEQLRVNRHRVLPTVLSTTFARCSAAFAIPSAAWRSARSTPSGCGSVKACVSKRCTSTRTD